MAPTGNRGHVSSKVDVVAILLNLLALTLVLGISWLGMMWLASKVHRGSSDDQDEDWVISEVHPGDPCPECEGVGARQKLGRLEPCPLCEGTGVYTAIS